MSLNRIELIGRLGRDPEARTLPNGGEVVNFSMAVDERWTDKNGERQSRATWFQVCIFNEKIGEIAKRYLRKGDQAYIAGAMQSREYEKGGAKVTVWECVLQRFRGELVLLGGRGDDSGEERQERSYAQRRQEPRQQARGKTQDYDELDDEIPF